MQLSALWVLIFHWWHDNDMFSRLSSRKSEGKNTLQNTCSPVLSLQIFQDYFPTVWGNSHSQRGPACFWAGIWVTMEVTQQSSAVTSWKKEVQSVLFLEIFHQTCVPCVHHTWESSLDYRIGQSPLCHWPASPNLLWKIASLARCVAHSGETLEIAKECFMFLWKWVLHDLRNCSSLHSQTAQRVSASWPQMCSISYGINKEKKRLSFSEFHWCHTCCTAVGFCALKPMNAFAAETCRAQRGLAELCGSVCNVNKWLPEQGHRAGFLTSTSG